jgi:hypothetical protein
LEARNQGGRAASNAAIFTFVNNATLFGRHCGALRRAGSLIRSSNLQCCPPSFGSERGWFNKPSRSLAMPIVTSSKKFFKVNHQGDTLFQVSPGIPMLDALEQASCFLESSYAVFSNNLEPNDMDFAAAHLIKMAKALVDSVTSSIAKGNSEVNHGVQ